MSSAYGGPTALASEDANGRLIHSETSRPHFMETNAMDIVGEPHRQEKRTRRRRLETASRPARWKPVAVIADCDAVERGGHFDATSRLSAYCSPLAGARPLAYINGAAEYQIRNT
jgi:hypothetical protein